MGPLRVKGTPQPRRTAAQQATACAAHSALRSLLPARLFLGLKPGPCAAAQVPQQAAAAKAAPATPAAAASVAPALTLGITGADTCATNYKGLLQERVAREMTRALCP